MTDQSQIDTFVEWAKARLDEMSAAAKVMESQAGKLDGQLRQEAERTATQIHQWIDEGNVRIRQVQDRGESALSGARLYFDKMWSDFEAQAAKWVQLANSQKETFSAQAKAQLDAWQTMISGYVAQASKMHADQRTAAEAELERLKGESAKAAAQFGEFQKAGQASWAALSTALNETRSAFEKAAQQAQTEFDKARRKK